MIQHLLRSQYYQLNTQFHQKNIFMGFITLIIVHSDIVHNVYVIVVILYYQKFKLNALNKIYNIINVLFRLDLLHHYNFFFDKCCDFTSV